MSKQKVFVYDTTRGFSRFIRLKYRDTFSFDICTNPVRFEETFKENYDISFVTINEYKDLLNFTYIYKDSKYVFVASTNESFNDLLPKLKKIILLDLNKMRPDIIKQIDINLNSIKFDLEDKDIL